MSDQTGKQLAILSLTLCRKKMKAKDWKMEVSNVYQRNWNSSKRIIINRGGTSSSKTGSLLRLALSWLIYGKIDDKKYFERGLLSIVRKYGANLTKSVERDFETIIDEHNLRGIIKINKTNRTYTF